MGIGSEKRLPPRFINFVGSFREPGSNATLTGRMLGGLGTSNMLSNWRCFFFFVLCGVAACLGTSRSITCGPTGREQATNGGRREAAGELRSRWERGEVYGVV